MRRLSLLCLSGLCFVACSSPGKYLLPVDSPLLRWEAAEVPAMMPVPGPEETSEAKAPKPAVPAATPAPAPGKAKTPK